MEGVAFRLKKTLKTLILRDFKEFDFNDIDNDFDNGFSGRVLAARRGCRDSCGVCHFASGWCHTFSLHSHFASAGRDNFSRADGIDIR
jgi:hypothetical protein